MPVPPSNLLRISHMIKSYSEQKPTHIEDSVSVLSTLRSGKMAVMIQDTIHNHWDTATWTLSSEDQNTGHTKPIIRKPMLQIDLCV